MKKEKIYPKSCLQFANGEKELKASEVDFLPVKLEKNRLECALQIDAVSDCLNALVWGWEHDAATVDMLDLSKSLVMELRRLKNKEKKL